MFLRIDDTYAEAQTMVTICMSLPYRERRIPIEEEDPTAERDTAMRVRLKSYVKAIFASAAVVSQLLGCNDAVSPNQSAAIRITVKVDGIFPSDRFEIQVDGKSMTLLATEGKLVVRTLAAGTHTVSLVGLPEGCALQGVNPLLVETSSGTLSTVEFGVNCFAVGTLAFVSNRDGAQHIYLASPLGTGIRRLTNQLPSEFTPAWSPDGARLAFNSDDGTYVINRDGSGLRRLREGGRSPSWSPDARHLLVTDSIDFRIIPVDDANEEVVYARIDDRVIASAGISQVLEGTWSPDGSRIAFSAWTGFDIEQLYVMKLNGSAAQSIVNGNVIWDECGPEWAPDGQTIAVLSMLSRAAATVSASGGQLQSLFIPGTSCWDSKEGGDHSESGLGWSPDGNALAVTMRTPPWEPGKPWPENQRPSVAIVDVHSRKQLALIQDAYDPAWTK